MTASPSLLVAVLRARAQLAMHPRVRAGRRPKFFGPRPLIGSEGRIEIGDGFLARAGQFPVQFSAGPEGVLRIGDAVFFNQGVNVFAARSAPTCASRTSRPSTTPTSTRSRRASRCASRR